MPRSPTESTADTPADTPVDPQPNADHNPPPPNDPPPPADPAPADPALLDADQTIKDDPAPVDLLLHHVNGQIELVEHSPDPSSVPPDDSGEWVPDGEHELKRVKVYELIASRWVDQGTAFCFGQFQEETGEALLIARAERNYNDIILSTAIRSSDVYQRQQDTLIVWTEPDGVDYALSFQDPEGCSEVWNFILEVQRHMNSGGDVATEVSSSPLLGTETSVTTASIIRSGHLPQPQLGIIGEIELAIKSLARTPAVKERICEYIQQEDYIKSLIEVMHTAEDLESLENLHALCGITQTILTLNDHGLYEHIVEDDIFLGVVGMLEYDPDFPAHKANYREFLSTSASFHEPIPLEPGARRKIQHIYRLQFLKDVVLARALDDSTFNVLNSCILFNQIDIISYFQHDPVFLRDVVGLFVDEEMLNGGKKQQQGQGQGQQVQPQQVQPSTYQQPVVISLNGEGDNTANTTTPTPPKGKPQPMPTPTSTSTANTDMEVDSKPPLPPSPTSSPSPKLPNGTPIPIPTPNGRAPPSKPAQPKHYAFSPPDDLPEEGIVHRRNVISLIQHMCIMGRTVQLPARIALFRTLVDRGILFAVQWALALPERLPENRRMIGAAGEVLAALLEHDLNGVRGHVLKQVVAIEKERELGKRGAEKAVTILELVCRLVASSREMAVQSMLGDALKVWMDVPPGDGTSANLEGSGPPKVPQRKDDPGTERYMDYFYKDCVHILFRPLNELVEWKTIKEPVLRLTREDTNRFVLLCDLLHNFILQHHFRSHFYVISSNIAPRVASLLRSKEKHLRHSAFRIFRLLLKQNNPNAHLQMMKHDILKPILDLTIQESRRDNLLSCSCLEYFEIMRRENMKEMIKFCMTKHEPEVRKLSENPLSSQRFELLIRRYEMNNEPPPVENAKKPLDSWMRKGFNELGDAEEEDYFNADDDEDEVLPSISHQHIRDSALSTPLLSSNTGLKRKRRSAIGATSKGYRPQVRPPSPALGSLVDYDEDEDDSNTNQKPSSEQQSGDMHTFFPLPSIFRQQSSKRPAKEESDEEEKMQVPSRARSQSPAPPSGSATPESLGPMWPSEKRRRSDDDEDELLERLSKSKKMDLGTQKSTAGVGKTENGDDPPKKMKLKLGATSIAVASPSPSPSPTPGTSETGVKDGDTG